MLKRLTQAIGLGALFAAGYILAAPRVALCDLTGYECDTLNFVSGSHCASDPETSDFGAKGYLVAECGTGGCCAVNCSTNEFGEEYCSYCTALATKPIYDGPTGTVIINGQPPYTPLPSEPLQRGRNPVGG